LTPFLARLKETSAVAILTAARGQGAGSMAATWHASVAQGRAGSVPVLPGYEI
jgi:hypothetical protein